MRIIILTFSALLSLLFAVRTASAYTLVLNILEDRLELRQTAKDGQVLFGYGDLTIQVEAKNMGGRQWRLQVMAIDDLRGAQTIPVSEVTWDALSKDFYDGKLVKGVPQVMVESRGDSKMVSKVRFTFKGEAYEAGMYDAQIRFILSSP